MEIFNLDSLVILLTLVAMIACGIIANRKSKDSDDYIIAGRSLKWPVIGFHGMASYVGAGTMGTIGYVYLSGNSGSWYLIALTISFVVMVLLVPRIRNAGKKALTIGDIIENRYSPKLRIIYGLSCGPILFFAAAAQLVALASIGTVALGIEFKTMVLIFGIVALVYTYLGGFLAVAYTDLVQGIIIVISFILLILPATLMKVGGFSSEAFTSLPSEVVTFMPSDIQGTIGMIFVFGLLLSFFTTEAQRMVYAAASEDQARKGFIFAALLMIPVIAVICIAGLSAMSIVPGIERSDLVFPTLVQAVLPSGLAGLALAGLVAAVLSTLDTVYITGSVIIYQDVIQRLVKKELNDKQIWTINKVLILGFGLATLVVAYTELNILTLVYLAYDIAAMVLAAPVVMAFFWPRATTNAALVSMIAGIILWPTLTYLGHNTILVGFPIMMVLMIVISLIEKPNPKEQLQEFYNGFGFILGRSLLNDEKKI